MEFINGLFENIGRYLIPMLVQEEDLDAPFSQWRLAGRIAALRVSENS